MKYRLVCEHCVTEGGQSRDEATIGEFESAESFGNTAPLGAVWRDQLDEHFRLVHGWGRMICRFAAESPIVIAPDTILCDLRVRAYRREPREL